MDDRLAAKFDEWEEPQVPRTWQIPILYSIWLSEVICPQGFRLPLSSLALLNYYVPHTHYGTMT